MSPGQFGHPYIGAELKSLFDGEAFILVWFGIIDGPAGYFPDTAFECDVVG